MNETAKIERTYCLFIDGALSERQLVPEQMELVKEASEFIDSAEIERKTGDIQITGIAINLDNYNNDDEGYMAISTGHRQGILVIPQSELLNREYKIKKPS